LNIVEKSEDIIDHYYKKNIFCHY